MLDVLVAVGYVVCRCYWAEGGVLFRSHGAMVTQPVPSVPHEESGAGKASRDGAGLHSPFTVSSCQRVSCGIIDYIDVNLTQTLLGLLSW